MRRQATLILGFIIMLPVCLLGQNRYYHDLSGMVDSTGVTHLTYQYSKTETLDCGDGTTDQITYTKIHHRNTATGEDSVLINNEARSGVHPCDWTGITFNDIRAVNNNPRNYVVAGTYSDGFEPYGFLEFLNTGVRITPIFDGYHQAYMKADIPDTVFINMAQNAFVAGIPANIGQEVLDSLAHYYQYDRELPDTNITFIEGFHLYGLSPFQDRLMFGLKNDSADLYKLNMDTQNYTLSDTTAYDVFNGGRLYFDRDSSHIYRIIKRGTPDTTLILRSDLYGKLGSWQVLEGPDSLANYQIVVDPATTGVLYAYSSDSSVVYYSDDYGTHFSQLFTFEEDVKGLYKSPANAHIYVLTSKKLFEQDDGGFVTLAEVPTSVEEVPGHLPDQTVLHQNYPNPFNPTTLITYEVSHNTNVKLSVYSTRGRLIQVLVNKRQRTGLHRVIFNTGQLSSGVYIYHLKTDYTSLSKKMVLIK